MTNKNKVDVVHSQNHKARQYHWLFSSCFVVFLFSSLVTRLMPWRWGANHGSSSRHSIIREAKEQAGMFVGFLFANY
jgi:hypothetical protein